jgi:hypothetical protein
MHAYECTCPGYIRANYQLRDVDHCKGGYNGEGGGEILHTGAQSIAHMGMHTPE